MNSSVKSMQPLLQVIVLNSRKHFVVLKLFYFHFLVVILTVRTLFQFMLFILT